MTEGHIDLAALSAAVIAVAVAMSVVPGPFDPVAAIVALTLILVLLAYIRDNSRTPSQSLAVAAIFGLILIPIVGFLLDLRFAADKGRFLFWGDPSNCGPNGTW